MTEELELPLAELDRLLRPLRRTLSFGARSPDALKFVEDNLGRWVQEMLGLSLPDALREDVVVLAGQISGFDDATDREERIQLMRAAVLRLDALLGLPLPPQRLRALRKKIPLVQRGPVEESGQASQGGQSKRRRGRSAGSDNTSEAGEEDSGQPAPERRKGRGRRGDRRSRSADAESADRTDAEAGDEHDEPDEHEEHEERAPRETRSREPRQRGWNGDPSAPISVLGLAQGLRERLEAAGLTTVGSVLFLRPGGSETLKIHGAGRDLEEGRVAIGGRRVIAWTRLRPDGSRVTEAILRGAGDVRLLWMDAERAQRWLERVGPGERTVVVGAFDGDAVLEPLAVRADGKQVRLGHYQVPGVDDEEIQQVLATLIPRLDRVRDPLPPAYRAGQPSLPEALAALHGSGDPERGRARLAFDESVVRALVGAVTALADDKPRGIQHNVLHTAVAQMLSAADTQLNDAQELVLDKIKRDLRGSRPMRRVVFGEPGGGKGLVALCAAAAVAESKCQVVVISSDPILTEQRFAFAQPLLAAADLESRKIERVDATARDALKKGQASVIFGGAELLDAKLEYRRLGLVIVDDDDGSISTLIGARPTPTPDLLVVPTGTPSTAKVIAGWPGFFMSYLEGAERPNVVVKPANQRVSAYAQARHALLQQGQVAVLFPLVENRDALDPTEASRVMKALSADALPGARLSLYHGAMPREDRVKTYQDFRHRRSDALLATTALEESAPVPGLQVAVVEHAHKMSPSRLARLAGLGVGHVSLVVAEDTPEEQIEHLRRLVSNGWSAPFVDPALEHMAHVDFESGSAEQLELLVEARNLAMNILTQDRQLRSGSHVDLVRLARDRWSVWFQDEPCPLPEPVDDGQRRRRKRRRRR